VEFLQCDVSTLNLAFKVDTVVMNPPFGTKIKGVDMMFLEKAFEIAELSVYSLHKTATREHISRKAKHWGADAEVLAELRFDIPAMYRFHKRKAVDIEVDFWRFDLSHKKLERDKQ